MTQNHVQGIPRSSSSRKLFPNLLNVSDQVDRGTLVDHYAGTAHPKTAQELTSYILGFETGLPIGDPAAFGDILNWSFEGIESHCRQVYLGKRNRPSLETPRQYALLSLVLLFAHCISLVTP